MDNSNNYNYYNNYNHVNNNNGNNTNNNSSNSNKSNSNDNKYTGAPLPLQPVYNYVKKEHKPLDKKDIIFVVLFLISAFLIVDFALFHYLSTGFFISYVIFFAISTAYICKKQEKVPVFSLICGALSVLQSFTFALYNDELMMFLGLVLMGILYSLFCIGMSRGNGKNSGSYKLLLDDLKSVVISPFSNIGNIFGSAKASAKNNKKSFGGVLGFLVAIPVLSIIIPLLAKSDAAFEGLITSVIKNIGLYLGELIIAVILLAYIYPFAFAHRHFEKSNKSAVTVKKCFPVSASVSFLSAISLVYVVYLFSQLAYFFSAFGGILPSDYEHTASAFARRGFYEMFAVCVINIAIISIVSMFVKKKSLIIKLISGFISLFSVLLIVIAMKKMELNIGVFGLSKNRILVSVLMLMAFIVIAFFIIHIFAPKIRYIKPIILICSAMFIALSYTNIDLMVAKYNIDAYNSGKIASLDIEHIYSMSDSAVPELVKLCSAKDDSISAEAKRYLAKELLYDGDYTVNVSKKTVTHKKNNDFRSYNRAQALANRAVCEYFDGLSDTEKEYFLTYYTLENEGYYDEEEDAYYNYLEDSSYLYHYDKSTGAYTVKTQEVYDQEIYE